MNKPPKIGIGVTTYKRSECLNLFLTQLDYHEPFLDYKLHIEQDNPNVANAKNNCLYELRDCDYMFLFDDDCFPIKSEWELPFIISGYDHLLYMNDSYGVIQRDEESIVTKYVDCSGCFMFITSEIFKKVGYFNTAYQHNGLEHIGYSTRIKKATDDNGFLCLNKTNKYIYSLDLQGVKSWKVHHGTTINREERELATKLNMPILMDEITSDKLYYENNIFNKLVQG